MNRPLTPRQRQILELLAIGWDSVDIAEELKISVQTVKNHKLDIYRQVGSHNLAETFYLLGWLKVPNS